MMPVIKAKERVSNSTVNWYNIAIKNKVVSLQSRPQHHTDIPNHLPYNSVHTAFYVCASVSNIVIVPRDVYCDLTRFDLWLFRHIVTFKAVLIGDPKQLPPVILFETPEVGTRILNLLFRGIRWIRYWSQCIILTDNHQVKKAGECTLFERHLGNNHVVMLQMQVGWQSKQSGP